MKLKGPVLNLTHCLVFGLALSACDFLTGTMGGTTTQDLGANQEEGDDDFNDGTGDGWNDGRNDNTNPMLPPENDEDERPTAHQLRNEEAVAVLERYACFGCHASTPPRLPQLEDRFDDNNWKAVNGLLNLNNPRNSELLQALRSPFTNGDMPLGVNAMVSADDYDVLLEWIERMDEPAEAP